MKENVNNWGEEQKELKNINKDLKRLNNSRKKLSLLKKYLAKARIVTNFVNLAFSFRKTRGLPYNEIISIREEIKKHVKGKGIIDYLAENRELFANANFEFYKIIFEIYSGIKEKTISQSRINTVRKQIQEETVQIKSGHKQEPIEKTPDMLAIRMNWSGKDAELEEVFSGLRGEIVSFSTLPRVISGEEVPKLTGSNIYVDALALFYVLAENKKLKIKKNCFKQIAYTFNIDLNTVKTQNEKMYNPISKNGINKDNVLHKQFVECIDEIKKLLNF